MKKYSTVQKRPKMYYVPGMITLVCLPILCYFYLKPYMKEERIIEITFASKYDSLNKNQLDTSFLSMKKFKRNYRTIELTGNSDTQKLDTFRLLVRKMVQTRDTVFGVHLTFIKNAKYGSFVQSINICRQESLHTFAPFENHLWALYMPLDRERIERIKKRRIDEASESREISKQRKIDKSSIVDRIKWALKVWQIFIIIIFLTIITNKITILKKFS